MPQHWTESSSSTAQLKNEATASDLAFMPAGAVTCGPWPWPQQRTL